jgi:para-nitrobenzyl esterase
LKKFISILIFLFFVPLKAFALDPPTVQVETGRLQGAFEYNMQTFKNIPYAAPPTGELRWRPPQPALSWTGIRDASQYGLSCPQPFIKNLSAGLALPGDEDCLKLNVFAPRHSGKNLPVMV